MSKTLFVVSFLFVVLSLWLERNVVESRKYDILVSWKKHPAKCYQVTSYIRHGARTGSACQRLCGKENRCKSATYGKPICSLSSSKPYHIGGCSRKTILYEKVVRKKLRPTTKPPETAAPKTSAPETAAPKTSAPETTTELIMTTEYFTAPTVPTKPASRFIAHRGRCMKISHYHHYNTKHASHCKRACEEDARCLLAIYRAGKHKCGLASHKRRRLMKKCARPNVVFERVDLDGDTELVTELVIVTKRRQVDAEVSDNSGSDHIHVSNQVILGVLAALVLRNLHC